ncbi:MAG: OmpA family protein [Thermodesulfobacteriota bacterium]
MASGGKKLVIFRDPEEAEHAPHGGSWKVAYADFVTALMALFLLLWLLMALKPQQKENLAIFFQNPEDTAKVKASLQSGSPTPVKAAKLADAAKLSSMGQVQREVAQRLKDFATRDPELARRTSVSGEEDGVLIQVSSAILFEPGSATLTPGARRMLGEVAAILDSYGMELKIRGHTDDQEQGGRLFRSTWELSAARAAAALRELAQEHGAPVRRMSAAGYADTMPLVPNEDEASRARNRRIELLFTPSR